MLFCLLYLAFLSVVKAIHNVTVDDNDPSIIYQPPASWDTSIFDMLDAGGQHKFTSDPQATASFTFTGVGIYFYSPLWTFSVTTQVALDDLSPVLLDLRDYNQPFEDNGPETVQSSVVWSQTGLANTQHTLVVSVGNGQTLAILDTLMYTVLDAGDTSSSTSTSTAPSSTSTTKSSAASKKGLAITLGVVCVVFGLLVISGIRWLVRRWQRRGDNDYNYPQVVNDDIHSPEMSNTNDATPGNYSTHPAYSRGRDARIRSIPTESPAVSNRFGSRSAKPSVSTIRNPPSKLKNPLTTIPEAPLREASLVRHNSQSTVQGRQRESMPSLPQNANDDE